MKRNGHYNGVHAGRPKGVPNKVKLANADQIADAAAERIVSGGPITPRTFSKLMPNGEDVKRLQRVLNTSIETFNQQLGERLAILSDKIADRIEEKIDADEFKPGELGFIFSVTEDKRRALDARSQLGSAQVNIQVNNYGDKSREEIMADLQAPFAKPAEEPKPKPKYQLKPNQEINPEDVI